MDEIFKTSLAYFQAPQNYFWRWAENGDVIEWVNGTTICFREELLKILDGLTEHGLPSLGALLLILTACQDDWNEKNEKTYILENIAKEITYILENIAKEIIPVENITNSKSYELNKLLWFKLKQNLNNALKLLDIVSSLPSNLRSKRQKIYLICEIFKDQKLAISPENVRQIKDELGSGRLDKFILVDGKEINLTQFDNDLKQIQTALEKFSDKTALELKLKTGISKPPEKADINIPEQNQISLLDQLAEDKKTSGISQLTRRLIAVINFPIHSQGNSEFPFGGFSDITNRGDFDRLLLSELAQDDLLLTARLINNEALYYRREEPPANPIRPRTILIDSTLRMWGIPRVFAISAALACSQNKNNLPVNAYVLGSKDFYQVDLSTRDGITDSLQYLDTGLHCIDALKKLMQILKDDSTDYILISDSELLKIPVFQSELKEMLNFLITVNRNGELQFYEFNYGRTKLLSDSKFDLEQLLFSEPVKEPDIVTLPAFLSCEPSPLYFPNPGIHISSENTFYLKDLGIITITEQQNVLYWEKKGYGAIELINFIEKGIYYFGWDERNILYILVLWNNSPQGGAPVSNDSKVPEGIPRGHKLWKQNKVLLNPDAEHRDILITDKNELDYLAQLKFYKIFVINQVVEIVDFGNQVMNIMEIAFENDHFFIRTINDIFVITCIDSKLTRLTDYLTTPNLFTEYYNKRRNQSFSEAKKFINNGYNALRKVRNVFLNNSGQLSLDIYSITPGYKSIMLKKTNSNDFPITDTELIYLLDNPKIKFFRTFWEDGSEAVMDSRGFLHLKSSDKSIPEITIVLIVGKNRPLTCWASDGTSCGNHYFIKIEMTKEISEEDFYKHYIQRFIDKLIY